MSSSVRRLDDVGAFSGRSDACEELRGSLTSCEEGVGWRGIWADGRRDDSAGADDADSNEGRDDAPFWKDMRGGMGGGGPRDGSGGG